ncbi:MAG: hypothetical protein Q9178_002165 [Gyalolechia marmorata]
MLVILDPVAATQITVHNSLEKHPSTRDYVYPLVGEKNLVTLEGKEWKMWRGIFNPGFASNHLMSLVGGMVLDTVRFTEILSDHAAKGDVFKLEDAAMRLTVDIIGNVVLDMPLQAQTSENDLVKAFRDQLHWMPLPNDINFFRVYNPMKWIVHRANTRIMNQYLDQLLEQRFADRQQEKRFNSKRSKPIIDLALDTYLKETGQSDGSALPRKFKQSAIDQFKTFLFAGHDTTSSTACYIIHLLSMHPAVMEKVRKEHNELYGCDTQKAAEAITNDPHSLNRLPYTMAVLKEVLRLFPPISTVRRGDPNIPIHFNGRRFPTDGFMVWPAASGIQRRPELWPDAEKFIPERFLAKEGDPLCPPKGAWRPFEYGPRNCIGQELAYIELKIFMVLTLRDFDIRPAYEEQDKLDGKDRKVPGGSVEADDPTVLHGLAREVFEETGLRLTRFMRLVGEDTRGTASQEDKTVSKPGDPKRLKLGFEIEVSEIGVLETDTNERDVERYLRSVPVDLDPHEHQDHAWVTEEEVKAFYENGVGRPIVSKDRAGEMLEAFRLRRL